MIELTITVPPGPGREFSQAAAESMIGQPYPMSIEGRPIGDGRVVGALLDERTGMILARVTLPDTEEGRRFYAWLTRVESVYVSGSPVDGGA